MILRELFILFASFGVFAAAIAAYLVLFHGEAPRKEVFSTAGAAVIGLYAGRFLQNRLSRNG